MPDNNNRPSLSDAVQQWDATQAAALIGTKFQTVLDAASGGNAVVADPQANLHVSNESSDAFPLTGLDLSQAGVPAIPHTVKRAAGTTSVVTVTLAQQIDGNTSATLDAAGASITLMPIRSAAGVWSWIVAATFGTVTLVP